MMAEVGRGMGLLEGSSILRRPTHILEMNFGAGDRIEIAPCFIF